MKDFQSQAIEKSVLNEVIEDKIHITDRNQRVKIRESSQGITEIVRSVKDEGEMVMEKKIDNKMVSTVVPEKQRAERNYEMKSRTQFEEIKNKNRQSMAEME